MENEIPELPTLHRNNWGTRAVLSSSNSSIFSDGGFSLQMAKICGLTLHLKTQGREYIIETTGWKKTIAFSVASSPEETLMFPMPRTDIGRCRSALADWAATILAFFACKVKSAMPVHPYGDPSFQPLFNVFESQNSIFGNLTPNMSEFWSIPSISQICPLFVSKKKAWRPNVSGGEIYKLFTF